MKPFVDGDRVWYEPSAGLRFAGVVVGDGTLANTARVRVVGHYGQWKSANGTRADYKASHVAAAAHATMVRRSEHVPEVDG